MLSVAIISFQGFIFNLSLTDGGRTASRDTPTRGREFGDEGLGLDAREGELGESECWALNDERTEAAMKWIDCKRIHLLYVRGMLSLISSSSSSTSSSTSSACVGSVYAS